MRKWSRIIVLAAIILLAGGIVGLVLLRKPPGPPDLVYDGYPLSFWVDGSHQSSVVYPPHLDAKAVPYLVNTLGRSNINERFMACKLLGTIGGGARPAVPALVRALRSDEGMGVRVEAAGALGKIANRDDQAVVEALSAAAKVPDQKIPWLGTVARWSLDHLGQASTGNGGITNGK